MAKKHIVKCAVCGKEFDLNTVQGVKYNSRRYAHQTCFPQGEIVPLFQPPEEDKDFILLKEYIDKLMGKSANWALINKQIKQFVDEKQYTYSGIKKSLDYFYRIKGNSLEKANGGIGIVPFVYQDAYNYYFAIWEAQQRNTYFTKMQTYQPTVVEIHIESPERQPMQGHRKAFSFLNDEDAFKKED